MRDFNVLDEMLILRKMKLRVVQGDRFPARSVTRACRKYWVSFCQSLDGLGNQERVGLDYKELPRDVRAGDILLLNDGLLVLIVESVKGEAVNTIVKVGGELSNNKGINKQGGGLTAPALTAKDMEDIKTAASF